MSDRKKFMDLKKPENLLIESPISSQEFINIKKIALDGTFQVDDRYFSRSYVLLDLSYRIKDYKEKLLFLEDWCSILNIFDCSIKISIINKKRDLEFFKEKILYQMKSDGFNQSRKAYNDIIWNKIITKKNGQEQIKIITVSVSADIYEDAVESFDKIESNLIKELGYIGSGLIPLNADSRLTFLYNIYNPTMVKKISVLENVYTASDWKNELSSHHIKIFNDYIKINDGIYKCFYIDKNYPASMTDDFVFELSNLLFVSYISTDYLNIDKEYVKKIIEQKYLGVESDINKVRDKRKKNNDFTLDIPYRLEKQKKEIKEMLDDINDNDQHMFWVGITIVIYGKNPEEIEKNENTINMIVKKHNLRLKCYTYRQQEAFNSAIPLGIRQVDMMRAMFTQTTCILHPFSIRDVNSEDCRYIPMYYGVNPISKNAILANRKNLINGNGFVFGVPGGGKSFTGAKMEIGSVYLNSQDYIIIIDPTLEYFSVCDSFGGSKLKISLDTELYFNPLDVDIQELKKNPVSIISEKSEIMQGICEQIMEGRMDGEHASLIDRGVRTLYRTIAKEENPVMSIISDLCDVIRQQPEEKNKEILLSLELFVDGSYNIYNHHTNVETDNRLTVYGMSDFINNKKLFAVSMLIILECIKKTIYKNAAKGIATWIYIDEIHVLLKSQYAKNYIVTFFKLVRKLGGICTGITQNICDLLKDEDTSTLISNSEYTVFLKQSAIDTDLLIKAFNGMNNEHIKYISKASPGTGLIRFGETIIPLDNKIDKNNPIYDIYNTNLHEKAALEIATKERKKTLEEL